MLSDDSHSDTSDVAYSDEELQAGASSRADTSIRRASQPVLSTDTSFDAYFLHASKAARTSANVFSQLVQPLSPEEYATSIRTSHYPSIAGPDRSIASLSALHRRHFVQFLFELDQGFNLAFYGFGSKRKILNEFAIQRCRKRGPVIVMNAYSPNFSLNDVFAAIEKIPGILDLPLPARGLENQARRICDFFASSEQRLFLIIHNLDAPALRTAKAKACLSPLFFSAHVSLVASVDHINAPILWSSSEMMTRRQNLSNGGFGWLWHDLTTLQPYDTELAFADRSSIKGATTAHSRSHHPDPSATSSLTMTETAAQHILASVTERAKKLFVLMAHQQLEAMEEAGDDAKVTEADKEEVGIAYDVLYIMAKGKFVATSDTALRALLGEFKDHSLVVTREGSGERLWIPMRKERLMKVLDSELLKPVVHEVLQG